MLEEDAKEEEEEEEEEKEEEGGVAFDHEDRKRPRRHLSDVCMFVGVNCDEEDGEARAGAPRKWPNLLHCWLDGKGIRKLNISFVPNRIIVDLKSGKIVKWWDGSFGKVLKGPWASNDKNPYKGLVEEINECAKPRITSLR